jgi:ClpP class serine protease
MANIFGGLLSRVLRVRIEGNINQKLYLFLWLYLIRTDTIVAGLKRTTLIKPEAIMITISSSGGSLTQAKNIADILKQYSEKKK